MGVQKRLYGLTRRSNLGIMVSGSDLSELSHTKGSVAVGMPVEVQSCDLYFDRKRKMRPMLLLYGQTDEVFGEFPGDIGNVVLDSDLTVTVALDFTDEELSELAYSGFYQEHYELPDFSGEMISVGGMADFIYIDPVSEKDGQMDLPILVVDVLKPHDLPVQMASDVLAKDSVLDYFSDLSAQRSAEPVLEESETMEYGDFKEDVLVFDEARESAVPRPVLADAPVSDTYPDLDEAVQSAVDRFESELPPSPDEVIRKRDEEGRLVDDVLALSDESFVTASPVTHRNVADRLHDLEQARRGKVYDSQMPQMIPADQLVSDLGEEPLEKPELVDPDEGLVSDGVSSEEYDLL